MKINDIISEDSDPFRWRKGANGILSRRISPADVARKDAAGKAKKLAKQKPVNPHKVTREKLEALANKIYAVVGDTFPDGDPIDWLAPYVKKHFGLYYDITPLLDKAIRLHNPRLKGYYDYLETMWDETSANNPSMGLGPNPWKSS